MNKITAVVLTALLVLPSALVFAKDRDGNCKKCEMMKKKGMMGGDMMGMMKGKHTGTAVSATVDGGALVISGGKLIKYDNQLNVVKEVDLPKSEMMMEMMDMDKDGKAKASSKTHVDHAAHH